MITEITIMLETPNLSSTVEFWTNVLGFECSGFYKEQWVSLLRDNLAVMFTVPKEQSEFNKPHLTGSIYIRTDDVDSEWAKLNGKVEVCYEIENFDYGMREFAVFDNNGYLIQFGQIISI